MPGRFASYLRFSHSKPDMLNSIDTLAVSTEQGQEPEQLRNLRRTAAKPSHHIIPGGTEKKTE